MRALGLDIGQVRIGVALSDPLCLTAQGLESYERIGIKKDTSYLVELMKKYQVSLVVSGLPLGLSGMDTDQTRTVRDFVKRLENKARSSGIKAEFVFMDERFTTNIASQVLIQADVSRSDRKKVVDKMAATVILQGYLDKNRKREAPEDSIHWESR